MNKLLGLFIFLLFVSVSSLQAQITEKGPSFNNLNAELPEMSDTDLSIFSDEEAALYFVDFEQVAVNLNQIVVLSPSGEAVWKEDVFDLPVNTIYELDFSEFSTGTYTIELRAYTGVIRKTVQHNH